MRTLEFIRVVGEQVLAVVIVDRRADVGFRRGEAKARRQRLIGELLVARGVGRPQGAPLRPLGDARHERAQVVGIDAGGLIAGDEMREDEINLRIAGHRVAPADAEFVCGPGEQ